MKKTMLILYLTMVPLLSVFGQATADNVVSFGLRASANLSKPVLYGIPRDIKTTSSAGVEGGAFLDFNIGQRFFVRFNTLYSLQRSSLVMDGTPCPLTSTCVAVPVYAAWRFGNKRTGYCFVGVGPYTEFITWGRLATGSESFNPYHHVIDIDATTGEELTAMTDSHSGFGAMLGYELPCGLFLDMTAQMALTDMLAFDHQDDMWFRPLKLSLGLGWRW